MPVEARRDRWQSMMARIADYDIHAWRRDFLQTLEATER